jgi:NAD(P)-dependent dehydrogenase (short-subunit alcohol dehydrogenase family)
MDFPEFLLDGKVAIITGGAGGIGRAIDLKFAQAGADIIVCDVHTESNELKEVAEKVKQTGRHFLAVNSDVRRKTDVENLVRGVIKEFGHVDILVNNAVAPLLSASLVEVSKNNWDNEFDISLNGYLRCCQAVAKPMIKQKHGCIINMSSVSGIIVVPNSNAYGINKSAIITLTRMLALELRPYNIRINAIAPGTVKTERSRRRWDNPEMERLMKEGGLLNPIAEPETIANVALFLASNAANYITGQTIAVDGGSTLDYKIQ